MAETTRRWPTSEQMAERLIVLVEQRIELTQAQRDAAKQFLSDWFSSGGFGYERKIGRLTEKVKDALEAGTYGPLFEQDGTTSTAVGRVWQDLKQIYTTEVLDAVDEEGNLLP